MNELLVLFRYRSAAALLGVLCLFGTVPVGFQLGAFLLMGMLLAWLLKRVEGLVLVRLSIVLLH